MDSSWRVIRGSVLITVTYSPTTAVPTGNEAGEPSVRTHQKEKASYPLIGKVDVISHISAFTANDQFLFFASVSTDWRRAWGKPSTTTRAVTAGTSLSMLEHCFECGLGDNSAVCEGAARLGRLDLLQCARAHLCPFGETCNIAYERAKRVLLREERYLAYNSLFRWARDRGCAWKNPVSSVPPIEGRGHEWDMP